MFQKDNASKGQKVQREVKNRLEMICQDATKACKLTLLPLLADESHAVSVEDTALGDKACITATIQYR